MFYRNNLNTRNYNLSKKSIDELPLEELGRVFRKLAINTYTEFKEKAEFIKQDIIDKFEQEYADTHEAPYEGDYSHLENEILAKTGKCFGLGSKQQEIFTLEMEKFAKTYGLLKTGEAWFFPQMLKYIFEKIPVKYNTNGLVSGKQMFDSIWNNTSNVPLAILAIFLNNKRSIFFKTMTSEDTKYYSKLVPLFLAAYKRYGSIDYSKWDREEIDYVVEPKLADAMLTEPPNIPSDILIKARNDALTVKSGENIGSKRNAATTYSLYPSGDSVLYGMNELYRHMLCQTWCAHPLNATKYTILDSSNWDNTEVAPLIPTEVLKIKEDTDINLTDSPW